MTTVNWYQLDTIDQVTRGLTFREHPNRIEEGTVTYYSGVNSAVSNIGITYNGEYCPMLMNNENSTIAKSGKFSLYLDDLRTLWIGVLQND